MSIISYFKHRDRIVQKSEKQAQQEEKQQKEEQQESTFIEKDS